MLFIYWFGLNLWGSSFVRVFKKNRALRIAGCVVAFAINSFSRGIRSLKTLPGVMRTDAFNASVLLITDFKSVAISLAPEALNEGLSTIVFILIDTHSKEAGNLPNLLKSYFRRESDLIDRVLRVRISLYLWTEKCLKILSLDLLNDLRECKLR